MSKNRHNKNRRNQGMPNTRRAGGQRSGNQQRTGYQQSDSMMSPESTQMARRESGESSSMQSGAGTTEMSAMTSSAIESARKSLDSISTSAMEIANSALRSVKANPVPFALAGAGVVCAGAGITWLLLSGAKGAAEAASGDGGGTTTTRSSMSMPGMQQAKQSVKRAGEKASQLAHDALESSKKLESSVEDVVREHPIAVGAALLATGAAIGLAMPRTALEDGWLGRERDQLVNSARTLAQGAVSKVESIAKQVTSKASNGNNVAHA